MIRITVEMVPKGTGEPKVIATARIWNTGKGTVSKGEYKAKFLTVHGRTYRESYVHGFNRLTCSVWSLIKRALENVK